MLLIPFAAAVFFLSQPGLRIFLALKEQNTIAVGEAHGTTNKSGNP